MAFKISPFYYLDNTPVYNVDMEDGVLGKANKNGSIILSKDLDPKKAKEVIDHEKVHLGQMKRGDLDYDDKYVYWKGKKIFKRTNERRGKEFALGKKKHITKHKQNNYGI